MTNHCPRIALPLAMGFGIMLASSTLTLAASASAPVGTPKRESAALDSIRTRTAQNWNIMPGMAGAKDVRVRVHFRLNRSGEIVGEPKVSASGGPKATEQALMAAALRAVLRAAPFKNLPIDQYDDWKEVILNFDASDPAN